MERARRRQSAGATGGLPARFAALVVAGSALGLIGCLGCTTPDRPTTPAAKGTVRVRSMTDAAPIRALQPVGDYLFAVTAHGLDRWQPATGEVLSLSVDHGLPSNRVLAVAADPERRLLWIATDAGLGYYDVAAQTFSEIPPSPVVDVPAGGAAVRLAPANDGGVWIGHPTGLFHVDPAGEWTATPLTMAITAVIPGEDGWVWAGTTDGLVGRAPTGDSYRYGPAQGLDIQQVRLLARAPGGGVFVVGDNAAGKQRIGIMKGTTFASFKVSPDVRLDAIAPRGDGLVALGEQRLYAFGPVGANRRRLLTRDGVRLLAVNGDGRAGAPVTVELLPATLPVDSMGVAATGDQIWVGTRDLGIGAWAADARQAATWLRRRQLVADASSLSVACHAADQCWVATGTRHAWYFDGERFEPSGPESQAVLAVVRHEDGSLYALHRAGNSSRIEISKIEGERGETWVAQGVELETPGERAEVSFARFATGGVLWVGLRYRDGVEARPWGVAIVDLAVGVVAYHHQTHSQKERAQGVLPVPTDVQDGGFGDGDEVWFATREGAARLVGEEITVWNETTGMSSEVTRAIAVSPGGVVFVATGAGVGMFDGERWTFPRELSFPLNDLAIAADGKLWMATDRGVAMFDGKKVRRLDVRRGLLDNEVLDIQIDAYGRVWARSAGALAVITP